ncbi:hypothetical protein BCR43DRAFT_502565 [Syncephalastrum racemosum]|uniref:Uncharacterized protein n=1 Tax=Syncephalastrum racemosum TaxID=13706 RepID=A0A1X2HNF9_SYNRA|nr:hypothetical protein BCR43DRAFT_502565 [Syncephalastrum racemosum]
MSKGLALSYDKNAPYNYVACSTPPYHHGQIKKFPDNLFPITEYGILSMGPGPSTFVNDIVCPRNRALGICILMANSKRSSVMEIDEQNSTSGTSAHTSMGDNSKNEDTQNTGDCDTAVPIINLKSDNDVGIYLGAAIVDEPKLHASAEDD